MGVIPQGFSYARKEMKQCHTNLNVPAPTPAAVGSLYAISAEGTSNTVLSIRRSWTNSTTSTNATPSPTSAMVVAGNESVTATSRRTLSVRNVKSKAS